MLARIVAMLSMIHTLPAFLDGSTVGHITVIVRQDLQDTTIPWLLNTLLFKCKRFFYKLTFKYYLSSCNISFVLFMIFVLILEIECSIKYSQ